MLSISDGGFKIQETICGVDLDAFQSREKQFHMHVVVFRNMDNSIIDLTVNPKKEKKRKKYNLE